MRQAPHQTDHAPLSDWSYLADANANTNANANADERSAGSGRFSVAAIALGMTAALGLACYAVYAAAAPDPARPARMDFPAALIAPVAHAAAQTLSPATRVPHAEPGVAKF